MHGGETGAWCRTSVWSERKEVLDAMLVQDEQLHGDILAEQPPQDAPEPARVPAPPIVSRFLFVHVCGLRARQLRKGARARVDELATDEHRSPTAERVPMEDVRRGLVDYAPAE